MNRARIPVAAAATFLLAACGGGGGGGGGGNVRPDPAPQASSSTRSALVVSGDEIGRSTYITQSGAKAAWDQGYGGKDVVVGILDSGLSAALPEFDGRVHASSGNFSEDGAGHSIVARPVTDDVGHGTWVTSVLGASANGQKTVGIAPEATLLSLGFFARADMTGASSMLIDLDRLNQALAVSRSAGARIVNGSFSIDGDPASFRNALQQSVAAGQLLIFAAGNDALANPSSTARYAREAWANGQILAVGAVDARNVMTPYSNLAGDAMQFYLVARGDVSVSDTDGRLGSVAGTSFAAPQVSGAAALLMQKWPRLTASQTAGVLLTSAADLGAPGVDAVYGHGLLDIAQAMQPVGETTVATAAGTSAPVAATGLALPAGGVAGAVARASAAGTFTVAATDAYGRDFPVDLALNVSQAASLAQADLQQRLARDVEGVDATVGGLRLAAAQARPLAGASIPGGPSFFGAGTRAGWQFAGGSVDRLDHFFGLEGRFRGIAQPYFELARSGRFAGAGYAPSARSRLRAGMLDAPTATGQLLDLGYASGGDALGPPQAGDWAVAMTAGALTEKDRLFGMAGSGAFALAAGRSRFSTFDGRYRTSRLTEVGGSLTLGRTTGSAAGLLQFSPVRAWSAEARLTRANAWENGDELNLFVGRPLAVVGGTLSAVLPARLADDGTLGFREARVSLAGGPTESRLGLSYATPEGRHGRMSLAGMLRLNPDNMRARPQALFGLQYRFRFD